MAKIDFAYSEQVKPIGGPKPRVSVTFPPDHYAALERMAKEKRVSIAWVVRDAVQRYLEPTRSLFGRE
jgi:hypothetical protein